MIRNKESRKEIVIDLDGPDGNAYNVLGLAKRYARDIGYASDEMDTMFNRMRSGNYENLIKVFDEYFGDYVILETTNEELLVNA